MSHDLFIPLNVEPNDIAVLKLINLDLKENQREDETKEYRQGVSEVPKSNQTLEIKGFTAKDEVLFSYENPEQNLSQTFGFSLKYYKPHMQVIQYLDGDPQKEKDMDADWSELNKDRAIRRLKNGMSEGAYNLMSEYENDGHGFFKQYALPYSNLSQDVGFQQGNFL